MQLLNFSESINKFSNAPNNDSRLSTSEFEKLKIVSNTKTEENKSLKEECEKLKIDLNQWRTKLMQESERNNEYNKELVEQIKDLQTKNFELQKANKKYANDTIMKQFKEKNEQIFKLEEKLKDSILINQKLKKANLEKELKLRQELEQECQQNMKKTISKLEEKELEYIQLQKTIKNKDEKIDDLKQEVNLVYTKMSEISTQIENKNIDGSYQKLLDQIQQLKFENSKLEVRMKSQSDKLLKRENTIVQYESERDDLIKQMFEKQRQPVVMSMDEPSDLKSTGVYEDGGLSIELLNNSKLALEDKIRDQEDDIARNNQRIEYMEYANMALASSLKAKKKMIKLLKRNIDEIPASLQGEIDRIDSMDKQLIANIRKINEKLKSLKIGQRLSKAIDDIR